MLITCADWLVLAMTSFQCRLLFSAPLGGEFSNVQSDTLLSHEAHRPVIWPSMGFATSTSHSQAATFWATLTGVLCV